MSQGFTIIMSQLTFSSRDDNKRTACAAAVRHGRQGLVLWSAATKVVPCCFQVNTLESLRQNVVWTVGTASHLLLAECERVKPQPTHDGCQDISACFQPPLE